MFEEHFKEEGEISGTAGPIADTRNPTEEDIKEGIKTGGTAGIIGVHEILGGFPFQTIRLRDESISRETFGKAACSPSRTWKARPKGCAG